MHRMMINFRWQLRAFASGRFPESRDDDDDWHSCASCYQTIDEYDWKIASKKALLYEEVGRCHRHANEVVTISTRNSATSTLPQLARIIPVTDESANEQCCRDMQGNRILYLLPAQMDLSAASDSTFALCIAFYLERKLGRESKEKMAVVIDCRGGKGWGKSQEIRVCFCALLIVFFHYPIFWDCDDTQSYIY